MSLLVPPRNPWEMRGRATIERSNPVNRSLLHCVVPNVRNRMVDIASGQPLVLTGTPRIEKSRFGQGINVQASDNYPEITYTSAVWPNDWTLQMWLYPRAWAGGFVSIIQQQPSNGFGLFFDTSGNFSYIYFGGGGGVQSVPVGMPAGKVSNLVVTRTGTTMEFWLNGVSKGTATQAINGYTGNHRLGGDSGSGTDFDGFIYLTRIWTRALPKAEIQRIALAPTLGLAFYEDFDPPADTGSPITAPEISVTGNGNAITDGDATPSATDHTDFGSITQGGATVSRTFTVSNTGTATLTISSVTVPTGYTVTTALPGTIAASGSAPLVVRLDNATVGTKAGDITINSDDSDEAAFNFAVTGVVDEAVVVEEGDAPTHKARGRVVIAGRKVRRGRF